MTRSAIVTLLLVGLSSAASAQTPDPLAPLACLIGEWRGVGQGQPGSSAADRHISRAHGGRYIVSEGRSVYPVQERNERGEIYTQTTIFSYDRRRSVIVARVFDSLGFVGTYVQDRAASIEGRVVLNSTSIENLPESAAARYTFSCPGEGDYRELFELNSGSGLRPYADGRFRRIAPVP